MCTQDVTSASLQSDTLRAAELNDEFLKMTLSAVPSGSGVLWCVVRHRGLQSPH